MSPRAQQPTRHSRPVWNPGRGSYGNNLWQAYSPKLGRNVKLYSDLEYHHWILVEATPEIVTFCEQPIKMMSRVEGRDRASYIDMWVQWKDGSEQYRELKYAKDIARIDNKPFLRRQLAIQESWCNRHDIEHLVITDELVHANKLLLRNWRLILSILANAKGIDLRKYQHTILSMIESEGRISIGNLQGKYVGTTETIFQAAIFDLIRRGLVKAPLGEAELSYVIPLEVGHAI
ncbi:MAG TPA: TnsA endonuclease N-terminal domain-containing protein [Gallionella sp.]|nr:TnsA endonuclease N-terminal domain-containing protein [Gallionella sp.]